MLDKFEKFNNRLSGWFQWIGIIGMLVMMVITCADVIGAKVFKSPILGALDIAMLAQILAISFAASMTLIKGRHIQVHIFFDFLPERLQDVIYSVILLLALGLFVIIIWQLIALGYSFQVSGEYSPTAYIPMYPFAYGIAFASIPVCLVLLMEFLKSLTRSVHK